MNLEIMQEGLTFLSPCFLYPAHNFTKLVFIYLAGHVVSQMVTNKQSLAKADGLLCLLRDVPIPFLRKPNVPWVSL